MFPAPKESSVSMVAVYCFYLSEAIASPGTANAPKLQGCSVVMNSSHQFHILKVILECGEVKKLYQLSYLSALIFLLQNHSSLWLCSHPVLATYFKGIQKSLLTVCCSPWLRRLGLLQKGSSVSYFTK